LQPSECSHCVCHLIQSHLAIALQITGGS
jgi:hypothetical protein